MRIGAQINDVDSRPLGKLLIFARVLARGLVPSQLRRLGGGVGVIALALFLIAAMSALVLMFLAKLVSALVAVGFER